MNSPGPVSARTRVLPGKRLPEIIPIMSSRTLALLAAILVGPCFAQDTADNAKVPTIRIRILNGKNGKPIKDEIPNVRFAGDKDRNNAHTDLNGEVLVKVRSPEIVVLPNLYADCRFKGDRTTGRNVTYSVEKIIKIGIVNINVCGKYLASSTPGVLVL
jgi:hypothetical protein